MSCSTVRADATGRPRRDRDPFDLGVRDRDAADGREWLVDPDRLLHRLRPQARVVAHLGEEIGNSQQVVHQRAVRAVRGGRSGDDEDPHEGRDLPVGQRPVFDVSPLVIGDARGHEQADEVRVRLRASRGNERHHVVTERGRSALLLHRVFDESPKPIALDDPDMDSQLVDPHVR